MFTVSLRFCASSATALLRCCRMPHCSERLWMCC